MILLASRVLPIASAGKTRLSERRFSLKEVRSMNTEEDRRRGKQRQAIQQTTMMLPYFDE
jgi:hypothetical protein